MNIERIDSFNQKLMDEAPPLIETSIGSTSVQFVLRESFLDEQSLLEYDVVLPNARHTLQIQYYGSDDNPDFHRIEVNTPNAGTFQIVCFHCKKVGLLDNSVRYIEIEQVVKVSGQTERDGLSVQETNSKIKALACSMLREEGLLIEPENLSPRWHLGTYDTETGQWQYGQSALGFITGFLKVTLIMAHCRGNRGISLTPFEESPTIRDAAIEVVETHELSVSPELYKQQREQWEQIGLEGEHFVVAYERLRLFEAGREELANAVQHVALVNSAAGYDILSYELDGRPRYIECKSTIGTMMRFEMTANEWNRARQLRDQYYVYRVINVHHDDARDIVIIQDPYGKYETGNLSLIPRAYTVVAK